jgi:hypothetical protein
MPAGTRVLFQQSSAPTGWTKDTTHNDATLRVVSGTAGSGGSVDFTTAFNATNTVDGTSITTAQMPVHTHTVNDPGHAHPYTAGIVFSNTAGTSDFRGSHNQSLTTTSSLTGITNNNQGSGNAHTHTLTNLAVKYVDTILATKN